MNTSPDAHTKRFLALALVVFVGAFMFTSQSFAQHASAVSDDEPKLIGLKMYADWCGKCQEIDPKLEAVMPSFEGENVMFIRFDFTNDFATEQSKFLANRLNLEDVFGEHVGQTGYMVLLDPETHQELGRLTADQSEEELRSEIQNTLASQ